MGAATDARRAWVIWAVGLSAYLVAVFHRSSMAVAGLAATERCVTAVSATRYAP